MSKHILAIITARGTSKGVPRKNIREIAGRPLIAWTIDAALHSNHDMRLIVSTDDEEIGSVSREYGAEVPFLRPAELASDTATSASVVLHATKWLEENDNYRPELILLLQPTSPFRTSQDIGCALKIQEKNDADAVISVTPNMQPVQWLRRIDANGMLTDYVTEDTFPGRRQDAAPFFQYNGAIYVIKPDVLFKEQTFYAQQSYAYVMPPERSVDIDTKFDFLIAELLMQHQQKAGIVTS